MKKNRTKSDDFSNISDDMPIKISREYLPLITLENKIIDALPNATCIGVYVYLCRFQPSPIIEIEIAERLKIDSYDVHCALKLLVELGFLISDNS